jgi:hypothetical protein
MSGIGNFGELLFVFHARIPKSPDGYIWLDMAIVVVFPSLLLRLGLWLWLRSIDL